ncbi:MAG: DUF1015 domain-containing protein [Planctomycetes bacterium]|nr:DUF1015 domain-containing protein [Planctomycetota bacterium]
MSVIQPFPAIRYNTAQSRDISARLAPPYDVLDAADKRALLERDPCGFVRIDLPHVPPKSAGPSEVYAAARATLDKWLAEGIMVRDEQPAIYVYHQRYKQDGAELVRKMFFARLRLAPFGTGSVFPHEHTFGGPKEDRLALTKACAANLSPIFGLYEDADNVVAKRLENARGDAELARGTMDDVENSLWAVTDSAVIDEVRQLMEPKPVFIADGHHRYGTGLMHKDWYIREHGPIPADHPANFVLCVFCAMEDPGLVILPTHRVLPDVKITAGTFAGDPRVTVIPLEVTDPEQVPTELAQHGPQAVALYDPAAAKYSAIKPAAPGILDEFEPDHSKAWRALGLAFLHAYLLERVVKPKLCAGSDPAVRYIKSSAQAVEVTRETAGSGFLMQPTTMAEMRGVCQANDLMPHKSTYFYPKLASGLVINPLTA